MFISSDKIRVYPASNRDTNKDRNASALTENNITSQSHRLSRGAYIVEGLKISDQKIERGTFCIHGYIFYLKEAIDVKDIAGNTSDKAYLTFSIMLEKGEMYSESGKVTFKTFKKLYNGLDNTVTNNFEGIIIETLSKTETEALPQNDFGGTTGDTTYQKFYLPVAIWSGTAWTNIIVGDGTNENHWTDLKLDSNVTAFQNQSALFSVFGNNLGRNEKAEQPLETYLSYNLIIDGGEIQ